MLSLRLSFLECYKLREIERVRFARVWRAVLRMGHPLVRWLLQMMTQDGGTTAQLQGDHERCRGSTTKLSGM